MTGEPLNGQTGPTTAEQWQPANPLVRLLAGRWTLAVLAEPLERGHRYQDLHDRIEGIAHKVLTLTDQITFGVLAASVPRDAVDDAVAAAGKQARRRDGKLPPHVMVYFAMAMALFADEDYEEVAARLAGTLGSWGC